MVGPITKQSRRNLTLGEKLEVIRFIDKDMGLLETAKKFNLGTSTVLRINNSRDLLISRSEEGQSPQSKRKWKAKHPIIDEEVTRFVRYVRSQRIPVTLGLVQGRARMVSTTHGIQNFKASRGWVQKFLRRSGIQRSLRLHGKGDASLPPEYAERMREIREISSGYELKNIYNQDESGLLYRMGPSRTYLDPEQHRSTTRGTAFQKRKQRLTVVFAVNADGSHKLPIRYIGKSAVPVCFQDHTVDNSRYSSQSCAWMDTAGFMAWIHWWYDEVKKVSSGPWLLILDNCGGHVDVTLPNVRIEFIPKNTTATYQPLDRGVISQTKIRYRALLLRETIGIILRMQSLDHGFKSSSGRGRWGLREGQLPHVADAMRNFDQSWSKTRRASIVSCWLRSTCLPLNLVSAAKRVIDGTEELIDLTNTVDQEEVRQLDDGRILLQMSPVPDTPLVDFLNDLFGVQTTLDIHQVLNSPAPLKPVRKMN